MYFGDCLVLIKCKLSANVSLPVLLSAYTKLSFIAEPTNCATVTDCKEPFGVKIDKAQAVFT